MARHPIGLFKAPYFAITRIATDPVFKGIQSAQDGGVPVEEVSDGKALDSDKKKGLLEVEVVLLC